MWYQSPFWNIIPYYLLEIYELMKISIILLFYVSWIRVKINLFLKARRNITCFSIAQIKM